MNLPDHIILCRDIRRFIIERNGATTKEVLEKFPHSMGCLHRLARSRSITDGHKPDGTRYWKPSPIQPIRSMDLLADLSFENDD